MEKDVSVYNRMVKWLLSEAEFYTQAVIGEADSLTFMSWNNNSLRVLDRVKPNGYITNAFNQVLFSTPVNFIPLGVQETEAIVKNISHIISMPSVEIKKRLGNKYQFDAISLSDIMTLPTRLNRHVVVTRIGTEGYPLYHPITGEQKEAVLVIRSELPEGIELVGMLFGTVVRS